MRPHFINQVLALKKNTSVSVVSVWSGHLALTLQVGLHWANLFQFSQLSITCCHGAHVVNTWEREDVGQHSAQLSQVPRQVQQPCKTSAQSLSVYFHPSCILSLSLSPSDSLPTFALSSLSLLCFHTHTTVQTPSACACHLWWQQDKIHTCTYMYKAARSNIGIRKTKRNVVILYVFVGKEQQIPTLL